MISLTQQFSDFSVKKDHKKLLSVWISCVKHGLYFLVSLLLVGCQSPETLLVETDLGMEGRLFSRAGGNTDLEKSIIVDVRSRFEFEMFRLPRSFHAYWKNWSLAGFKRGSLTHRKDRLQRLLALKGIDPLTRVAILGGGLRGQGEEFLLASTLLSLGVKKLFFVTEKQVRLAVTARNKRPVENVPYWSENLKFLFDCQSDSGPPDIIISSGLKKEGVQVLKPYQVFSENLEVKYKFRLKKKDIKISSPNSFWAYGLVLYFRQKRRKSCVL